MKKIIFGSIILTLSLFALVNIAGAKVDRVPVEWDVTGNWVLTFVYGGNDYKHDIDITTQNPDGTFSGTGGYPAGGPYTITETIDGTVIDDVITINSSYDGSSYEYTAIGQIDSDGSMSGTLTTSANQEGTWSAPAGSATLVTYKNHGQHVRNQENKQEAAQSRMGMPVQSKGHKK